METRLESESFDFLDFLVFFGSKVKVYKVA